MSISGITSNDSINIQQHKQQPKKAEVKQESISFFDEKWSGHQIAKLTGDNFFTDWLQDKDKVCTDGCDDGKIGFVEGAKSCAKGLIGGIPKMMINHPVATAVTVGMGVVATALSGGAILPFLGAMGVASGVAMVGYGSYKAVTAKTDGETKQALETLGTGVTATALSVKSSGKILEKAANAGVKSAQVSEDANMFQKTVQMFKSVPEALKTSYSKVSEPKLVSVMMPQKEINLGNFDKNKTYVGLKYGTDNIASQVKYFSGEYCPGTEPPVHAVCLTYEDGKWWIYQSNALSNEVLGTPSGTNKVDALSWLKTINNKLEFFDLNVDVSVLKENIGQPYGKQDILKLLFASVFNTNGQQSDGSGIICSEYIALGCKDICEFYKLPAWSITPAHIKNYMILKGINPIVMNPE